jgi:glutathione S-transferase
MGRLPSGYFLEPLDRPPAMMLTLMYAPVSCALVPYVALTEAGAAFEVQAIDHTRAEHFRDEFLVLNPKAKLPVLVIDGCPLTENVAIQIWIARQFPHAGLMPSGAQEFQAIEWLAWFASGVHPHLTPHNRPQRYCDLPGSEDSVKRLASAQLFQDFGVCEARLAGCSWFFNAFSTVDIYFYWCFRRAMLFGLDLSRFQNCLRHFERMAQRDSVQRVLAFERQIQQEFLTRTEEPRHA